MTHAVCIKCGEPKWGALTPCDHCGARPTGARDISVAMLFSDHHYDAAQLAEISARIKRGERVSAPEAYLADYERSFHLRDGDSPLPGQAQAISRRGTRAHSRPFLAYLWSLVTLARRYSQAVEIMSALRRGERPGFALYLHAFKDGRSGFNRKAERLLAKCLGEETPLLALTGAGFPAGTVRLRATDEQWYEDFLLLATNAIVIFVQAASVTIGKGDFDRHQGLMMELRTLYERGLLGRTAIIQSHLWLGRMNADVNSAEILTPDGRVVKLQPDPVKELISYYSQFVGLDPPRPSPGMLLAWQIEFDPEVRARYSLGGLP